MQTLQAAFGLLLTIVGLVSFTTGFLGELNILDIPEVQEAKMLIYGYGSLYCGHLFLFNHN